MLYVSMVSGKILHKQNKQNKLGMLTFYEATIRAVTC